MNQKDDTSLFRTISTAFLILIMHVLLLGTIGALILFFYGVVNHMVWIAIGVACLSIGGYFFFRRIRSDSKVLKDIAGGSFKGKTVEVSFLGGVANFKISDSQTGQELSQLESDQPRQLEAPDSDRATTLTELARLYEKDLINKDEFNKAKDELLK